MLEVEHSIVINRPVEQVWNYLTDLKLPVGILAYLKPGRPRKARQDWERPSRILGRFLDETLCGSTG